MFNSLTSTSFSVSVGGVRNPISTYPINIVFNILTTSSNSIQTCANSFSATVPNSFRSISFINSVKTISSNNTIVLSLTINNPLPNTAVLNLSTTLPITYNYVGLNLNKPYLLNTSNGNLIIANITSTNISSGFPLLIGNFILTNPPYSGVSIPVIFSTQISVNSVYYSVDSSTVGISATPSTILQSNITVDNLTISVISNYLITFVNINSLI